MGIFHPSLERGTLLLDLLKAQAYWGRLTLLCSKKAGILAALVSENSGAMPSYINRSLASSQKFLFKYLSGGKELDYVLIFLLIFGLPVFRQIKPLLKR